MARLRASARMPGAPAWRPLVQGEDAQPVWQWMDRLERVVRARKSPASGLAGGDVGAALFLHRLARARGAPADPEVLARMERAVDRSLTTPQLGFLDGLAGVGWAIAHLWPRRPPRAFAELLRAVDHHVLVTLESPHADVPYELGRGLTGFALYALERGRSRSADRMLAGVVQRLAERLSWKGRSAWLTTAARFLGPDVRAESPEGIVNLGVAHGLPAVLVPAALAWRRGIAREAAGEVFRGVSHYLGRQLALYPATGGGLPSWTSADGVKPGRLAWCYGSVGAAGVMLTAARLARAPALREIALRELRALGPTSPLRATLHNLGLCHGLAGVLQVYLRAAHLEGAQGGPLHGQARAWLEVLLASPGSLARLSASRAWEDPPTENRSAPKAFPGSFLEGAAGLGLTLLAAVTDEAPDWDRALGLSAPAP